MKHSRSLHTIAAAALVLLAGCAGGVPGDRGSPTPADGSPAAVPTGSGTVAFYISDQPNAIGDFRHVNVTITRIGFQQAGNDSGGWIERDVDNATVDLTALQGDNATLIDEYDVPNGTYGKVFVYIGAVDATLGSGEQVRVKLPSQKLQVNKQFTVESGATVDFVFDITVHKAGKSGKYILSPVIGESGADVPIETDDDEGDGTAVTAAFEGNVSQGENATILVTRSGDPVENASVEVNGNAVGMTDADGRVTFVVPDAEELTVQIETAGETVELEREFESSDD